MKGSTPILLSPKGQFPMGLGSLSHQNPTRELLFQGFSRTAMPPVLSGTGGIAESYLFCDYSCGIRLGTKS